MSRWTSWQVHALIGAARPPAVPTFRARCCRTRVRSWPDPSRSPEQITLVGLTIGVVQLCRTDFEPRGVVRRGRTAVDAR